MKKKYLITKEEFEVIKESIEEVLQLWNYDFISAKDEDDREISMSKEIFFSGLKDKFIIE